MFTAWFFLVCLVFFFFQAEDGIRDRDVTGVQTCALRSALLFELRRLLRHLLALLLPLSLSFSVWEHRPEQKSFPPFLTANSDFSIVYEMNNIHLPFLRVLFEGIEEAIWKMIFSFSSCKKQVPFCSFHRLKNVAKFE